MGLRGLRRGGALLALLAITAACSPTSEPITQPAATPVPAGLTQENTPALRPDPELHLAFVGDILLGGGLEETIAQNGSDYPWVHARLILKRADLAVGNLETAVTLGGTPAPDKQFTFRSRPETLKGAASAGIDVLSLANNHALDYGPEALLESVRHLREAGIHPVGAGKDAAEAFAPVTLEIKGLKLAIFGFTRVIPVGSWAAGHHHPGLAAGYDPKPVLDAIDEARPKSDVIIVLFHWGEEVKDQPRPTDINLAKEMFGHGATLVIGHHPHILQGIHLHDGNLIAYSLGNFIFTSVNRSLNQETGILEVTVKRSGVTDARFTPFHITAGQPRPVSGRDGERILTRLDHLSRPWGTTVKRDGTVTNR